MSKILMHNNDNFKKGDHKFERERVQGEEEKLKGTEGWENNANIF